MTRVKLASTLRTGVALAPRPGCSAKRVPMTAGEPRRERATTSAVREMCCRGSVAPAAPGSDVVRATRRRAGSAASVVPAKTAAIAARVRPTFNEKPRCGSAARDAPIGVTGDNTNPTTAASTAAVSATSASVTSSIV
jgi:hypothetical protein